MTTLETLAGLARAAVKAEGVEAAAGGLHVVRLEQHPNGVRIVVRGVVTGRDGTDMVVVRQHLVSWANIESSAGRDLDYMIDQMVFRWTEEAKKRESRDHEKTA